MTPRLDSLCERVTTALLVLLAVGGTLLARPRGVGAVANCKPQRAGCKTNQDCCSGVCTANICAAPTKSQAFPGTGQTTCWDSSGNVIPCARTGQDGDVKAGAPLSYTDNGDGTITDNNTGLVWEKQTQDGSIHDVTNMYSWEDAFAVHVAMLNGTTFAGHNDWRVPNVKEMQSIVNYENFNPSVSPAFNTGCASMCTTCSCTAVSGYWSSTTNADAPILAWGVHFFTGFVGSGNKTSILSVRAVRGGS